MAILSNINGKFAVDSSGGIQFSGQTGTSGYVLKSNGNAAPTWVDGSTVIGGPYLPLSGGTLTGATATASGISFTVGGILGVTGAATFGGNVSITKAGTPELILTDTTNNVNLLIAADDANTFLRSSSGAPILFQTNAGTTALTLSGANATFAGNVGIGGTLANKKLYVLGNTTNYQILAEQPSGYAGLSIKSTTVAQTWSWLANDNGSNSDLLLYGGASAGTKLTIDSSGNVGIGTDSPNPNSLSIHFDDSYGSYGPSKGLDVTNETTTGDAGFVQLSARYNAGGANTFYHVGGIGGGKETAIGDGQWGGFLSFFTTSDGTAGAASGMFEHMRITADGNVGIGTTNPYAQLHISHSSANGGLMLGNTATTGSKEMLLNIYPLGLIWQRWVNGAFESNLMILDYDGHLGIGNTNPSRPLDITSDSSAVALRLRARTNNDYSFMQFTNNAGTANWSEIYATGAASSATALHFSVGTATVEKMKLTTSLMQLTTGAANQGVIQMSTDAAYQIRGGGNYGYLSLVGPSLRFDTNGSQRMKIDSGGTVEIGGTIQANGGIKLGGTATANKLDFYQQGIWTPTLKFGGNEVGITYGGVPQSVYRGGHYVKIGNVVTFSMRIILTSKGTSTGQATFTGLPYDVGSLAGNYGSAMYTFANNFAIPERASITMDSGSSIIRLRFTNSSGNYVDVTNGTFNNNSDIILTGTYISA